jgi:hypothetical protein
LQSAVDIEIVSLAVVLKKGCPKYIVRKIDFNPGCDEQQIVFTIWMREFESGILNAHDKITKWLESVGSCEFIAENFSVEKFTYFNIGFEVQLFSAVCIVSITKGWGNVFAWWNGTPIGKGSIKRKIVDILVNMKNHVGCIFKEHPYFKIMHSFAADMI